MANNAEWVLIVERSADDLKKNLDPAMRSGLNVVGDWWWTEMLPDHFKYSAYQKYGYRKRSFQYELRKARTKGHRKPLVWSGTLERTLRGMRRVSSTSKSVRVSMSAPRWVKGFMKMKGADQQGPDKEREIKTITRHEAEALCEVLQKHVTFQLNGIRRVPRTIGG